MATKRSRQSRFAVKLFQKVLALGVFSLTLVAAAAAAPIVVTLDGPLEGIATPTVNEYLGIPYAVPPVGLLRWTPPQPHGSWHGVLQATQFSNFCPQPGFGSEDCLYLNVYTPPNEEKHWNKNNILQTSRQNRHQSNNHGLPVMVWIHGGALVTGGGGFYDPTRIIEQSGVIVVTVNYRLGFLGFFAHPAIDAEGHLNGNYGLMDQQLALTWVRRNIAAFGGDPNRVTIFGESAGGQSVYANLASPTAAGLFRRAISESGSYVQFQDYFDSIVPLAQAETIGTTLVPAGTTIAEDVGCSSQTAACLRGVAASALVGTAPATLYPFVDGTILTQTLGAAFASGQFNRVPIISGGNHDEWRLFVASEYDAVGNPLVTFADYENATDALFGSTLGPFLYTTLYPLADYPNPGEALGASGTDDIFACPERNGVQLLAQYVPTYTYEFNDEDAYLVFELFPPVPPITFPLGAPHFSEVPYLFDVFSTASIFTPDQEQLSEAMISYWTRFAATGNPNSSAEPLWSPYNSATDEFQSLLPPTPAPETSYDNDHFCSLFWNTF
jgi:para-nitrobenzyl esterase